MNWRKIFYFIWFVAAVVLIASINYSLGWHL